MILGSPRDPAGPIQKALYDRLSGDTALLDLATGGVHDHTPEGTTRPYVVIGEAVVTPDNTHDRYGHQTLAGIHVWTEARGHAQGLAITDRIVQLLDHQPLTVVGHQRVAVRFQQTQPLRDSDPQIRHVVLKFRISSEQEN